MKRNFVWARTFWYKIKYCKVFKLAYILLFIIYTFINVIALHIISTSRWACRCTVPVQANGSRTTGIRTDERDSRKWYWCGGGGGGKYWWGFCWYGTASHNPTWRPCPSTIIWNWRASSPTKASSSNTNKWRVPTVGTWNSSWRYVNMYFIWTYMYLS